MPRRFEPSISRLKGNRFPTLLPPLYYANFTTYKSLQKISLCIDLGRVGRMMLYLLLFKQVPADYVGPSNYGERKVFVHYTFTANNKTRVNFGK